MKRIYQNRTCSNGKTVFIIILFFVVVVAQRAWPWALTRAHYEDALWLWIPPLSAARCHGRSPGAGYLSPPPFFFLSHPLLYSAPGPWARGREEGWRGRGKDGAGGMVCVCNIATRPSLPRPRSTSSSTEIATHALLFLITSQTPTQPPIPPPVVVTESGQCARTLLEVTRWRAAKRARCPTWREWRHYWWLGNALCYSQDARLPASGQAASSQHPVPPSLNPSIAQPWTDRVRSPTHCPPPFRGVDVQSWFGVAWDKLI